jgi:glutamine amidotransferase-like uncharacterized protein
MSDSTTPTTTEDPSATTEDKEAKALQAIHRIQAAFIEETETHKSQLVQMGTADDAIVQKLCGEILDRVAIISHFFGIEYGAFFPLNAVEFLLLAKWQGDAARLSAFIGTEETRGTCEAKLQLDALYAASA